MAIRSQAGGTIPADRVFNLRADLRHADGSPGILDDGQRYALFNNGPGEIHILFRLVTEGVPEASSSVFQRLGVKEVIGLNVKMGEAYYATSVRSPSNVVVAPMIFDGVLMGYVAVLGPLMTCVGASLVGGPRKLRNNQKEVAF